MCIRNAIAVAVTMDALATRPLDGLMTKTLQALLQRINLVSIPCIDLRCN